VWLSAGAKMKPKQGSNSSSTKKAGRKQGQHRITAVERCNKQLNGVAHEGQPSYSEQQLWYDCACRPLTKHVLWRGVRSANHSKKAMACHVCGGKGSKWERILYERKRS
jgi:hypothetical protein